MSFAIGKRCWVLADGYIPADSTGAPPEMLSHEALCILNTGSDPVRVVLTLYFEDRDPVGPYEFRVEGRRTRHQRFNDLSDPAPVPKGIGYACVLEADAPVVVQQTRLDSRQSENALLSTLAYPA
ncbi:sensory rhodopsin transducer [Salipiger sp. IMCC34102]|uniref:sensory rhodopsin transducer n=1 Tax=Salipiger sp. IMCC34102 TaxID=2510647 RepID=UPI00101D5944|nr:sensory rhodopsin transducer [Salipiger sp. IMCC34102]RYH02586.1 sensory rhodopsin transducer [Salipiger sp. IMCC34102]